MKKMHIYIVLWGIVVVAIISLLTVFGFLYKSKTKVYKDLEEKLVEAEKKYADAKFLYPKNGENVYTSADKLIAEKYLDNINIKNDKCSGYAQVLLDGTVYKYKAFIKCDKYTTKGYNGSNVVN